MVKGKKKGSPECNSRFLPPIGGQSLPKINNKQALLEAALLYNVKSTKKDETLISQRANEATQKLIKQASKRHKRNNTLHTIKKTAMIEK